MAENTDNEYWSIIEAEVQLDLIDVNNNWILLFKGFAFCLLNTFCN